MESKSCNVLFSVSLILARHWLTDLASSPPGSVWLARIHRFCWWLILLGEAKALPLMASFHSNCSRSGGRSRANEAHRSHFLINGILLSLCLFSCVHNVNMPWSERQRRWPGKTEQDMEPSWREGCTLSFTHVAFTVFEFFRVAPSLSLTPLSKDMHVRWQRNVLDKCSSIQLDLSLPQGYFFKHVAVLLFLLLRGSGIWCVIL